MQYTIVARSGGTVPVAVPPNTLVTQGAVNPIMNSQVAISSQTNTQTWTTNADSAIATIDLNFGSTYESGADGEAGLVIPFLV
jgi:hypothetical protein